MEQHGTPDALRFGTLAHPVILALGMAQLSMAHSPVVDLLTAHPPDVEYGTMGC